MKGAVYNENDPYCAEWLRNLIEAGHIAAGDVDERSIEDVSPDDWRGYAQVHAFAGIGLWSYSLRRSGWPDERPVWTGSCPCQPFSQAGQGGGFDDKRHLWPAWFWLIGQHGPDVVLGEQVASKDGLGWFDLVSFDLEGAGYTVGASDLCAAGVGGPHIRQRLWFVGLQQPEGERRLERRAEPEWGSAERGRGAGGLRDAAQHRIGSLNGKPESEWRNKKPSRGPSGACGLSDSQGDGWEWRQDDGDEGRRERSPGPDSATGELFDANGARPQQGEQGSATVGYGRAALAAGGASGLPDTHGGHAGAERQQRSREHRLQPLDHGPAEWPPNNNNTGLALGSLEDDGRRALRFEGSALGADNPLRGFWRGADWIWYRDGKYRPVEGGTFPLAPGDPNRVGRLRAYGNAISPEVACAFIDEVMALCP